MSFETKAGFMFLKERISSFIFSNHLFKIYSFTSVKHITMRFI